MGTGWAADNRLRKLNRPTGFELKSGSQLTVFESLMKDRINRFFEI
jgi:hypothetical protein